MSARALLAFIRAGLTFVTFQYVPESYIKMHSPAGKLRRRLFMRSLFLSYVVRAELPDTAQHGEFELQRHFEAPRTLQFIALHYSGDGFVKSNIIIRLLQSEVDHVKQDDGSLTAVNDKNYKFSYKGTAEVN